MLGEFYPQPFRLMGIQWTDWRDIEWLREWMRGIHSAACKTWRNFAERWHMTGSPTSASHTAAAAAAVNDSAFASEMPLGGRLGSSLRLFRRALSTERTHNDDINRLNPAWRWMRSNTDGEIRNCRFGWTVWTLGCDNLYENVSDSGLFIYQTRTSLV